jgi:hypothetical protein
MSDVQAYLRVPLTDEEVLLGEIPIRFDLDDDGVGYDVLCGGTV